MKRLLEKIGPNRKKDNLKKDGDRQAPDGDGSSQPEMPDDTPDVKSTHVDRKGLDNSMQAVSRAIENTRGITGGPGHDGGKLADYGGQLGMSVVERLSVFTNAVQKIADVHPYSKMAWMIISSVVTVVTYTQGIDQDIQDLFETLDSTYKFIGDTKEIEKVPAYERILANIAKQTVDCAYFIRAYVKNSNFWIRAGKNLIGRPIKPRVQTYKDAFAKLLTQFQIHSALHTEIATGRLLECNQSLKVSLDLDSLPYAGGAGLQTGKQCLVGTRTEILDEIVDWINNMDDNCPRLFWLAGPAGVGKSAIAHTIALRFESIGRLGSFFCFDKNDSTKRREKVFSTIARDLADLDPQIKHQLAEVVQNKASLRSTTDLHLQWKNFVFQPLHATSEFSTGPILVVIDGLDESGDPISRQDFLNILGKEIPSLPPNIRFLVTSRPERDITLALKKSSQSYIRSKMMDAIPVAETNRDIFAYFKAKLAVGDSYVFEDAQLKQLVNLSQGLFQWAYLASQFLQGLGNTAGLTIVERYEDLINVQRICSINDPLDAMYTQILSSLFNSDDPRVMARFRSIIGNILAASEPLTLNGLVALRGDNILPSKMETDVKEVIQHMGALLSGISDPSSISSIIRPIHLSFREYLLDKNRSHHYSVDLAPCHQGLAFGCLRTMMEGLTFNICNISTSYRTNADDENLPERVSSSISTLLSYSSRFWAVHVTSTVFDHLLATKTQTFLRHGFLLWLEVLSLLKAVNIAVRSMSGLMAWSSGKEAHETLYNFVADGKRFIRLFVDVITASVPHIYISALPFCPQDSIIYQTFITRFPNTLRVVSGPITGWPSVQQRDSVGDATCICFSYGEDYLAVGLQDVLQLLDMETLDVLWTVRIPKNTDNPEPIRDIEFYTSDKHLVFATSLHVYLFDILTGSMAKLHDIYPPPLQSRSYEREITFSQNAKFVAYIRGDHLTVWNLQTQECAIQIPCQESYSPSYCFLNDDSGLFVTYSMPVGAQVWDLQTGVILPALSRPPPDIPLSFTITLGYRPSISPNGIHIIFARVDHVHVWNFRDNSVTVFDHDTFAAGSLAISPNGDYLVTGTTDNLIVYDIKGNKISYEGTPDLGSGSCAFSKDGKRFAVNNDFIGYLKIWELDGWQDPAGSARVDGPNLSPVTRFEKASPAENYNILLNSMEHANGISDIELDHSIWKLSWHDMARIAQPTFSSTSRYFSWIESAVVNLQDFDSGTTKEFYCGDQKTTVRSLVFSEDETVMATLAVNLSQGTIHIHTWDLGSSRIINTLTIPDVIFGHYEFPIFKASSDFRYFAYSVSDENIFLYNQASQSIPLNFLTPPELFSGDYAFNFHDEHIYISSGPEVFRMDLITNEYHATTLQGSCNTAFKFRQMYSARSSGALLFEIYSPPPFFTQTYKIWNAFTGELRYVLQPYPSVSFKDFLPAQQYLVTSANETVRVSKLKLREEDDTDWICFSSDEKHSLKSLPRGSSATLRPDGWVIAKNNELLFWVPNEYHETLHIPGLKYLIGRDSTKLDLSSFAHGQSWSACCNA